MAKNFRGIIGQQEVTTKVLWRDTRTIYQKFGSNMEKPEGFCFFVFCALAACFFMPSLTLPSLALSLWLCRYASKRRFMLPFRMPQTSNLMDPNDPKMGTMDVPGKAAGIAYLGNEINTRKELWFKNDDMRTHLLIFGSTGAGKTEALISIAYNALVQASGFIYVDGKGDSALFAKIFALARAMGREDDLLVINYMTGSRDVFGPQATKLSNTLNPFTSGSSGGLTELLVSLMDDSGGDNAMWKGRAISLISSIMMGLVHMRDQREILLDVDLIRDYLILENIIKMAKRRDLPAHVIVAVKAYLKSLPGYQDGAQKQSETVMDQHGYLQMQFTKILGSLADSYGYIFRTNLGEVDFWDVVANRRILLVLLPALEKSPEELANLGKIVVACLKQMMATGLGSMLEGEYKKIIETKPTYAKTPFLCILDEYGYYAVKGAAVMPAQARSLGFSMIFAGQDYPAFEKASKEEAASTVANCNIKIFMKLEDPKETYDLFHKLVGEAYVTHVSGYQANVGGLAGGYSDMQNANVEKRARGDLLDLKEQREGEAHVIFKSSVIRADMFYAAPKMPEKLTLNYFLKIEAPERTEVMEMDSGLDDLMRRLTQPVFMKDLEDSTDSVQDIELAAKVMSTHGALELMERGCAAVAAHHDTLKAGMDAFRNSMGMLMDDEDEEDERVSVFNGPDDEMGSDRDRARSSARRGKPVSKSYDEDEDEDDDYEHPEEDDDFPVFLNEKKTRSSLERIEKLSGETPEQAAENAERLVEDMKAVSQYPHAEAPEDKSPDDILEMLKELDEKIDELEQESDN